MITKKAYVYTVNNFLDAHPEIDRNNRQEIIAETNRVWDKNSKDGKIDSKTFREMKGDLEVFAREYETELKTVWATLKLVARDVMEENYNLVTLDKIKHVNKMIYDYFYDYYIARRVPSFEFYDYFKKRIVKFLYANMYESFTKPEQYVPSTFEVTPQADATITVKGKTCTIHVDKKEGTITLSAPHMKIESARILPTPEVILKA